MKKLILSMMALAAIATANAEELNATVENNNETTVEVAAPFEAPAHPALSIDTSRLSLEESTMAVVEMILQAM